MAAFVNTIFFSINPSGLDVKEAITVILKIVQQIKPVTFSDKRSIAKNLIFTDSPRNLWNQLVSRGPSGTSWFPRKQNGTVWFNQVVWRTKFPRHCHWFPRNPGSLRTSRTGLFYLVFNEPGLPVSILLMNVNEWGYLIFCPSTGAVFIWKNFLYIRILSIL